MENVYFFGYGLKLLYCAVPPANNRGSIWQAQHDVASMPLLVYQDRKH